MTTSFRYDSDVFFKYSLTRENFESAYLRHMIIHYCFPHNELTHTIVKNPELPPVFLNGKMSSWT